jgi:hypothetical protein
MLIDLLSLHAWDGDVRDEERLTPKKVNVLIPSQNVKEQ